MYLQCTLVDWPTQLKLLIVWKYVFFEAPLTSWLSSTRYTPVHFSHHTFSVYTSHNDHYQGTTKPLNIKLPTWITLVLTARPITRTCYSNLYCHNSSQFCFLPENSNSYKINQQIKEEEKTNKMFVTTYLVRVIMFVFASFSESIYTKMTIQWSPSDN